MLLIGTNLFDVSLQEKSSTSSAAFFVFILKKPIHQE